VGGDKVFQHAQTFSETGKDGPFNNFTGRLGHQSSGSTKLANLLAVTPGTGIHHKEYRVHVALTFVFLQIFKNRLGNFVGRTGPDINDLIVALTSSDEAFSILSFDFIDLFPGGLHNSRLVLGNDHIINSDRNPGHGGRLESKGFQPVQHMDGFLFSGHFVAVQDQVAQLALGTGEIDESDFFGPERIE